MQIIEALSSLGLNEKEAKVYLALLQLGRASAYAVSEKAQIKRPTTYVILGELMQKGLVLKIPRSRKQLFIAKSPGEFFAESEERLRAAKQVLPQLVAMSEKPEKQFRSLYFEGERGLKEMFGIMNDKMKGKEIPGFFGKLSSEAKHLDEYFQGLNEERKNLGIRTRGVTPDDPSLEWYKDSLEYFGNTFKYLNINDYSSDCSIEIGDGFIQIVSFRFLQGLHIENPDIANTMRQIFEMVWKSRPEKVEGAKS